MNTPVKYFMMEITDNNYSAEYVGMAEFELYDDGGNKIVLNDSMLEVDSFYNGSFTKANLIDGNLGTKWCNNNTNPSWVKVTLPTEKSISKVRFYGFGTVIGQAPYTFNFQVSENGTDWVIVKEEFQKNTAGIWYETNLSYTLPKARITLKNPTTNKHYSLAEKTLIPLPNPSPNNMISYGLAPGEEIQLNTDFDKINYPYGGEIIQTLKKPLSIKLI